MYEPEENVTSRGGVTRSLTDQTMIGFAWHFLGAIVEICVRIGVMILLARLLSPSEFGVVSAAMVVINLTQIFSQLGVAQSIVQLPRITDEHIKSSFALSVWASALAAIGVYLLSGTLADLFRMPELAQVVRTLSVCFLLTGPSIVALALLQRLRRYREIASIDAGSFAFGFGAVGVGMAALHFGIWALVSAQIAQVAIRSALSVMAINHPRSLLAKRRYLKDLFHSGAGFSVGQLGNFFALNADNSAVGRLLGAHALGLYSRAYQFLMIPANLFGTVVDKVLFPAMARVQGDHERLIRAFRRSLAVVALITIPLSSALVILAPELINVVLGPRWSEMTVPFQVLASSLLFRTSYKMSDSLARAAGAVYRRAWRQWLYAAAVLIGAALGAKWGLTGVALGVGAAILANFLLMLDLAIRLIEIRWGPIILLHVRYALVSAPTAIAVYGIACVARVHGISPLFTLVLSGIACVASGAVTIWVGRPFLGSEGRWLVGKIESKVRSSIAPKRR